MQKNEKEKLCHLVPTERKKMDRQKVTGKWLYIHERDTGKYQISTYTGTWYKTGILTVVPAVRRVDIAVTQVSGKNNETPA